MVLCLVEEGWKQQYIFRFRLFKYDSKYELKEHVTEVKTSAMQDINLFSLWQNRY